MAGKPKLYKIETIEELLSFAESATFEIQKQWGVWTVSEQLNEVFTEVGELNQTLRHNKGKPFREIKEEVTDEIWDVILSAITTAHTLSISKEELSESLERVVTKLKNRIKSGYYKKRGCVTRVESK